MQQTQQIATMAGNWIITTLRGVAQVKTEQSLPITLVSVGRHASDNFPGAV